MAEQNFLPCFSLYLRAYHARKVLTEVIDELSVCTLCAGYWTEHLVGADGRARLCDYFGIDFKPFYRGGTPYIIIYIGRGVVNLAVVQVGFEPVAPLRSPASRYQCRTPLRCRQHTSPLFLQAGPACLPKFCLRGRYALFGERIGSVRYSFRLPGRVHSARFKTHGSAVGFAVIVASRYACLV